MIKRILICLLLMKIIEMIKLNDPSYSLCYFQKFEQSIFEYKILYDKILFCSFDLCLYTYKYIKLDYIIN